MVAGTATTTAMGRRVRSICACACLLVAAPAAGVALPHGAIAPRVGAASSTDYLRTTPASMVASMAEAATAWLALTGNKSAIENFAVPLARYLMANGTTPTDWLWASMPFASSDPGSLTYGGANSSQFGSSCKPPFTSGCVGDGTGNIEPDKAANAAWGYSILANVTGDAAFRTAAIAVADTLAKLVRSGDDRRSPWPFRVRAKDGLAVENYTSNVFNALILFDELLGSAPDSTPVALLDGRVLPRHAVPRLAIPEERGCNGPGRH